MRTASYRLRGGARPALALLLGSEGPDRHMPPHRRGGIAALRQLAQYVTCRTALVPGAAPVSTSIASAVGRTTRSILPRRDLFFLAAAAAAGRTGRSPRRPAI